MSPGCARARSPTVTSCRAMRGKAICTGHTKRSSSSTTRSTSAGSPRRSVVPRLRVLEQHPGAEGQHAGAGLVAAEEDAVGQAAELDVVEVGAVVGDHPGDAARRAGAGCARSDATRSMRNCRVPAAVSKMPAPASRRSKRAAPWLPELLAVDLRHAEQVADDAERHREAEALHQVDLGPVGRHVVEGRRDDPVDVGLEVGQPAPGEVRRQHAAAAVRGRAGRSCRGRRSARPGARSCRPMRSRTSLAKDVGVGQHRPRDVVPRDQPDAGAEQAGQADHVAALAAWPRAGRTGSTPSRCSGKRMLDGTRRVGHAPSGRQRELEGGAAQRARSWDQSTPPGDRHHPIRNNPGRPGAPPTADRAGWAPWPTKQPPTGTTTPPACTTARPDAAG